MNGLQETEVKTYPAYIAVNERGVPAIIQCPLLKFKGSTGKNINEIFAWTKALSERVEEFEPLKTPPPKVDLKNRRTDEDEAAAGPRMALLIEAMEMLDPKKDFTDLGQPKIESLRKLVDEDVTLGERNSAFALFQSRKKR